MTPNWAEDNLQTIRTLMERSALYRRALAPVMLAAGAIGALAAIAGLYFRIEEPRPFVGLWFSAAAVAIVAALLLVRRQALKERESFWSPPARRVTQALAPPLLSGGFTGVILAVIDTNWTVDLPIAIIWLLFYGCALHSAGFFMARGIRWLGWLFIFCAMALVIMFMAANTTARAQAGNLTMGIFFGVLQLIYGAYLYATENKSTGA
jgi:hypothetical protein